MKRTKLSPSSIYTFLCVFLPILSTYISPIPGVELGTFMVLVFAPFLLLRSTRIEFHLPFTLGLVMVYTVLCTVNALTGYEFYSSPSSIILRTGRYIFLLTFLVGFGIPSLYKQNNYITMLSWVTIVVAVYAITQYIAYHLLGVQLPNTFGPVKQEAVFYEGVVTVYRPASFLPEPASAAYFMAPFLCYALFGEESDNNNRLLKMALLVSLGILCTTSGQGLIVLMTCWGIWMIKEFKSSNVNRLIVVLIIVLIGLSQIDLSFTINRIIETNDDMNAVTARREGYDLIRTIPVKELVFGKGFGNYDQEVFFSSFASIIYCTGIVNMVLVGIMYLVFFLKGNFFSKMLVICSLILMAGGGVYTATFICFYYPLLITNTKRRLPRTEVYSD